VTPETFPDLLPVFVNPPALDGVFPNVMVVDDAVTTNLPAAELPESVIRQTPITP
jgi:hypothetical protein